MKDPKRVQSIGNRVGASEVGGDILLDQLSAVLGSPSQGTSTYFDQPDRSDPILSGVGSILLHLSEAIASAKNEAARERDLRLALEAENRQLLMSHGNLATPHAPSVDLSTTMVSDATSSCTGDNNLIDRSLCDIECEYLTVGEIMMYISALPPHIQDCVYVIYGDLSGFINLGIVDAGMIHRIMSPTDVANVGVSSIFRSQVYFVMFSDMLYPVTIANTCNYGDSIKFIKFSPECIHNLVGICASHNSSVVSPAAAAAVKPVVDQSNVSSVDEQPRMNLLEALNVQSDDDVRRIITVRKCHKLGFKSHVFLKQYFSRFGKVERVVLLPMRAKATPTLSVGGPVRGNRPSSMGFVVFEQEATVETVLNFDNSSGVHIIKGWPIEVRNFVRPADRPDIPWTNTTTTMNNGGVDIPSRNSAFDITDSLW